MFKHILVPLDLSGKHARVAKVALALARADGARVTLLHVMQTIEHIPQRELRGFYTDLRVKAERLLARAAQPLERAGVKVRKIVQVGAVPREIVRQAAVGRIDLIVIDSHAVNPARPVEGLGSTSYKVAILCQCPVMLVK